MALCAAAGSHPRLEGGIVQSHRERAEGSQQFSVPEAWQTGGRFRRIRAATAPLTAAPHPHSASLEEARRARGCWRLATAPHWRAPRGAHAHRLRGAGRRPLGRLLAASVRPTHGGAGHRAPHRRATPPQPLFRRGAAGAWVLAAGNSAALAGATRRARIPAAGRRQSAFGAATRSLSVPHERRRRLRTAAHPRSYARVSVGSTRRACSKPAGEPPGEVLGVSTPPQCAHRRSARHLRQRRI